jgi:tetratricopeptide (TPR) repeat protein
MRLVSRGLDPRFTPQQADLICMSIPPNRTDLLASAVAHIDGGAYAEAEAILRAVLAENSRHPVAIYLLGMIAIARGAFVPAATLFRQALAIAPDQPRVALQLAACLLAQHRPEAAEAELHRALSLPAVDAPTRATLEQRLGMALKLRGQYRQALTLMRAAAAHLPLERDAVMEQANVLRHLGCHEEAMALYDAILANDPQDMAVHALLSELKGEAEPDFTASYDAAMLRAPQAADLPLAKAYLLLKAERPHEAEAAFRLCLGIATDHPDALAGLGRALEMQGDKEGARTAHARSVSVAPENGPALQAYARFLLRHQDIKDAEGLAETAWKLAPASQGALSLLDLCWRAQGDTRADWLNDYERDVAVFDLEPPDGYRDMESFQRDLAAHLNGLHAPARQYLTQTLRRGTQTHDELFHNGHAPVERLLPRLNDAIRAYVAGWRAGDAHPFRARLGGGFRYAGSWSSRLADCGFHVNHIHHKGWISSCYYVAVPDVAATEGWIKFGEPPEELGALDGAFAPRRLIQPKPGRLVLFPSYMWHGTVPFHAPEARLTMAFDAVPG